MQKVPIEKIIFLALGLTFFVGIWYAFPMLNVVNDEMYFVGGVLRAIEHHTIVPAVDDVPYGTLTYLLNYPVTLISLAVLLPFFKFSISTLKVFLIQSPDVMYLSLRVLSALLSLVMLFVVNKLLKKEIEDKKTRLFLILLLFTNIITTTILHTGKVWVLSILLVLCSFYYLYASVAQVAPDTSKLKKHAFLSILFAFLAFANFPLFIFSLVAIPLLLFFHRRDKSMLTTIAYSTLLGFVVFAAIIIFNLQSIVNQLGTVNTDYHTAGGNVLLIIGIFFKSFSIYFQKLILLFPLSLLTLLFALKNKVKNLNLLVISSAYFIGYSMTALVVAYWPAGDLFYLLRYMFPLGFFLTFAIASFDIKFKKSFYFIALVSVIYYVLTLYLLSIPTTLNEAYNWVNGNLADQKVVVVSDVFGLNLKKNKESALLMKPNACATKCHNIIDSNLNSDYKFLVIDNESAPVDIGKIKTDVYYIKDTESTSTRLHLITSYVNIPGTYHSVDYNMGNYFDAGYFRLRNLGPNIYIYKYEK